MSKIVKIIIIAIIVFALGLGGVYYFFIRKTPLNQPQVDNPPAIKVGENPVEEKSFKEEEPTAATSSPVVEPVASTSPVVVSRTMEEISKYNQLYRTAIEKKNKSFCLQIADQNTKDDCLELLAIEMLRTDLCLEINSEDLRKECEERILMQIGIKNQSPSDCIKFEDDIKEMECIEKLIKSGLPVEACEQIPLKYQPRTPANYEEVEPRDLCVNKINLKKALANNDLELCRTLFLSYQGICLSKILGIPYDSDSDNDGLSFGLEIYNGTDPDNPDTDGDGYTDKQEVDGDYNPLGEGGHYDKALMIYDFGKF